MWLQKVFLYKITFSKYNTFLYAKLSKNYLQNQIILYNQLTNEQRSVNLTKTIRQNVNKTPISPNNKNTVSIYEAYTDPIPIAYQNNMSK